MNYPKKVTIGDITVRDGFQHEEIFIPGDAKVWLAEQLILAGFRHIEVTNLGNPTGMPQFRDADEVLKRIRGSKLIADLLPKVSLTTITIREKAIERAIQARKEGFGPDRILLMVSTSESHHRKNSGLSLDDYWKMAEKYIPIAQAAGLKVNGTVSTIWGCPIEGPTKMEKAIEFTKRWFDIGANDVEHADHDGSASPDRVYRSIPACGWRNRSSISIPPAGGDLPMFWLRCRQAWSITNPRWAASEASRRISSAGSLWQARAVTITRIQT
jgi:hydroxymethylglutaryl-CoA lyase